MLLLLLAFVRRTLFSRSLPPFAAANLFSGPLDGVKYSGLFALLPLLALSSLSSPVLLPLLPLRYRARRPPPKMLRFLPALLSLGPPFSWAGVLLLLLYLPSA